MLSTSVEQPWYSHIWCFEKSKTRHRLRCLEVMFGSFLSWQTMRKGLVQVVVLLMTNVCWFSRQAAEVSKPAPADVNIVFMEVLWFVFLTAVLICAFFCSCVLPTYKLSRKTRLKLKMQTLLQLCRKTQMLSSLPDCIHKVLSNISPPKLTEFGPK